jgi:hypothetical protein
VPTWVVPDVRLEETVRMGIQGPLETGHVRGRLAHGRADGSGVARAG